MSEGFSWFEVERMEEKTSIKAEREVIHGKMIAERNPESIWGWKTPAGRVRALRRAEWISASANFGPGWTILEIDCGTGMFTERFEDCDVDGPFGAVIGSSVLHHLDIQETLAKIYELLKPGGIMSFAEPNMLNLQIMVQKNVPLIKARMGDSLDETAFFCWRIRHLLLKAGFAGVSILPCDWLHPATPASLIDIVAKAGRILEKLPVIREFSGSLHIRFHRLGEGYISHE
jgi:hypothetical protein